MLLNMHKDLHKLSIGAVVINSQFSVLSNPLQSSCSMHLAMVLLTGNQFTCKICQSSLRECRSSWAWCYLPLVKPPIEVSNCPVNLFSFHCPVPPIPSASPIPYTSLLILYAKIKFFLNQTILTACPSRSNDQIQYLL